MIENDDERPINRNRSQATKRRSADRSGATPRDGQGNGSGTGFGSGAANGSGFGSGGDYGYGSVSRYDSTGRPGNPGNSGRTGGRGRSDPSDRSGGRSGGSGSGGRTGGSGRNGGGSGVNGGYDGRTDGRIERSWQPVELGPRPGARTGGQAPDMPPGFRRVDNGSPRYMGPVHSDAHYSPTYYHFNRVREHEFSNPSNIWMGLLAIVGIALGVLIIFAIPQFLTHNAPATVESPSAPAEDSGFVVYVPTPTPPLTPTPSYGPTPTPAPTFRLYTVQAGDTVTKIANKFGIKTWELITANPALQNNPDAVYAGMVLQIPKHGQVTPAPAPTS